MPARVPSPSLVWFQRDLRIDDHPPLLAASEAGPVVPVFVLSDELEGAWPVGSAARWWLHHSLATLAGRLDVLGSRLVLRRGPILASLLDVAGHTGARTIHCSRRYEPAAARALAAMSEPLAAAGIELRIHEGNLLAPPEALATGAGKPYQVYTPFARAFRGQETPSRPRRAPTGLQGPPAWPASEALSALGLLPDRSWASGFTVRWTPGESGGLARLRSFVADGLARYADERDRPMVEGTSGLSPHLHWGEVSIRRVWHAVGDAMGKEGAARITASAEKFRAELLWREFAHHVLHHFPATDLAPLRSDFGRFPWRDDDRGMEAWRRGRTGYPLVDAGMRQLWREGWMHNRVRMVVASFLVKHLLLPWQAGARWFWDTLVDADLANNSLGWQWAAGCGADAAPYFRIFNPILQGEKFDPDGHYVRRYVPELAAVPNAYLHRPWTAPAAVLSSAGVRLGLDYPAPIVDHSMARERALAALAEVSAERAAATDRRKDRA